MAPMDENDNRSLRELVARLEARVEQLESERPSSRGETTPKATKGVAESIRMILIGPPGAGIFVLYWLAIPLIGFR